MFERKKRPQRQPVSGFHPHALDLILTVPYLLSFLTYSFLTAFCLPFPSLPMCILYPTLLSARGPPPPASDCAAGPTTVPGTLFLVGSEGFSFGDSVSPSNGHISSC